jgi:hypothetical protein
MKDRCKIKLSSEGEDYATNATEGPGVVQQSAVILLSTDEAEAGSLSYHDPGEAQRPMGYWGGVHQVRTRHKCR